MAKHGSMNNFKIVSATPDPTISSVPVAKALQLGCSLQWKEKKISITYEWSKIPRIESLDQLSSMWLLSLFLEKGGQNANQSRKRGRWSNRYSAEKAVKEITGPKSFPQLHCGRVSLKHRQVEQQNEVTCAFLNLSKCNDHPNLLPVSLKFQIISIKRPTK